MNGRTWWMGSAERPGAVEKLESVREEITELLRVRQELGPEWDDELAALFVEKLRAAVDEEIERRRKPIPGTWLVPLVAMVAGLPLLIVVTPALFMFWLVLWATALVITVSMR